MHTFPFISICQKKNCNMFARLVGHHPHHVLLDCLLICYFVMLPPTVFMYNLFFFISRFQTIFPLFSFLWIHLASQPRLARVSCFIRRAERTRSPIGIHGCKYRPICSDNRLFLLFILARSILTDCVLKLLNVLEVTQNGGNGNFELKGLCHEIFQNLNVENCHQI